MNIRKLQRGLKYRGRVKSIRQTYHVFETPDDFFVLSFALSKARRGSGYFNVVTSAAVQYVQTRLAGQHQVTAKSAFSIARRTKHLPTRLSALNALYVLVALDLARIARSGAHRQLFFSVRKARPGAKR